MATLQRDMLGEVRNTATGAGPAPSAGEVTARAIEAAGEQALRFTQGYVKAATEKDIKTKLGAFGKLRGVAEGGTDPASVFFDSPEQEAEFFAMKSAIESEAGTLSAAVEQGRLKPNVAISRIEDMVRKRSSQWPGFEKEIEAVVGNTLGFSTRGFMAKKILGLDETAKQEGERYVGQSDFEKRRAQMFNEMSDEFTPSQLRVMGFDQWTSDARDDIVRFEPLWNSIMQRKVAKANYEKLDYTAKATENAYRPLAQSNLNAFVAKTNALASQAWGELSRLDGNQLRQRGPELLDNARKTLLALKSQARTEISQGLPGNIEPAALNELVGSAERGIDSLLSIIDQSARNGQYEGLQAVSFFSQRADMFEAAPAVSALVSYFGPTAVGMMAKDLAGAQLSGAATEQLASASFAFGSGRPDAATQYVLLGNAMRAEASGKGKRYWDSVADKESGKVVTDTVSGIRRMFSDVANGNQMADPETVTSATLGVLKNVYDKYGKFDADAAEEGRYYLSPAEYLDTLNHITQDGVLNNKAFNQDQRNRIKTFYQREVERVTRDTVQLITAPVIMNEDGAPADTYAPVNGVGMKIDQSVLWRQTDKGWVINGDLFDVRAGGNEIVPKQLDWSKVKATPETIKKWEIKASQIANAYNKTWRTIRDAGRRYEEFNR